MAVFEKEINICITGEAEGRVGKYWRLGEVGKERGRDAEAARVEGTREEVQNSNLIK